jgi:hypothetical protein
MIYWDAIGLVSLPDWGYSYTASQSTTFSAPLLTATWSNLTDGSGRSGAATTTATNQSIVADLGTAQSVSSISVGGGTLPGGLGGAQVHLNGRSLQWSNDLSGWTTVATVSGVADSGGSQFVTFTFSSVSARYWRIFTASGYVATTEFVLKP